jgi:hypothetical protein
VSSPVAVEVDLSGIPGSVGSGSGYPTPRYHVGSLSFSRDATHYARLAFLSQEAEIFPIPFPGTTSIGYSFGVGITGTITEITSY